VLRGFGAVSRLGLCHSRLRQTLLHKLKHFVALQLYKHKYLKVYSGRSTKEYSSFNLISIQIIRRCSFEE
jgi:hypothetical protein